ncbi:MAG: lmo0937 family membrane protein [Blastocatellia bacterium]
MLWTIVTILLVLWFYGLIAGVAGNLIHLLLVIAVLVLVFYIASRGLL